MKWYYYHLTYLHTPQELKKYVLIRETKGAQTQSTTAGDARRGHLGAEGENTCTPQRWPLNPGSHSAPREAVLDVRSVSPQVPSTPKSGMWEVRWTLRREGSQMRDTSCSDTFRFPLGYQHEPTFPCLKYCYQCTYIFFKLNFLTT